MKGQKKRNKEQLKKSLMVEWMNELIECRTKYEEGKQERQEKWRNNKTKQKKAKQWKRNKKIKNETRNKTKGKKGKNEGKVSEQERNEGVKLNIGTKKQRSKKKKIRKAKRETNKETERIKIRVTRILFSPENFPLQFSLEPWEDQPHKNPSNPRSAPHYASHFSHPQTSALVRFPAPAPAPAPPSSSP